jgi:hypothetical protein
MVVQKAAWGKWRGRKGGWHSHSIPHSLPPLLSSRPAARLIASIASCLPASLHTGGEGGADSSGGKRALSTVNIV